MIARCEITYNSSFSHGANLLLDITPRILGCTRRHVTSRCRGLSPPLPHPFFEGKALGTRLLIVDIVRFLGHICTSLETLRSRFGHFTANDKLRFGVNAVNGFTLPFDQYYLGLTSILDEKLSSKLRFLKQNSIHQ